MSTILAIITAIVLIIWGMFRKPEQKKVEKTVIVKRYIHPGHTWVRITDDGDALVGIDDFAQSLLGTIESLELPRLLKRIEQGHPVWKLQHRRRKVSFASPVSGRVIEKNEMVLQNPGLINTSPYGDGWLLRVRPTKVDAQLNNLFTGKAAQQWQEHAKNQLVRMFSVSPLLAYQDGGMVVKNLSDKVSDDEWNTIAKEFFLDEQPSPSNDNHQQK